MKNVYIVTYHFNGHSQIEGVYASFKDAENHANKLRDEALEDGAFTHYVTNEEIEIIK